jgi:aspartate aminotransferase
MVFLDNANEELNTLRNKVRDVTKQIMLAVQQRMELAREIGEVKSKYGIDVKDEKVEDEVRLRVALLAKEIGMNSEFALQLLNVLIAGSQEVQQQRVSTRTVQKQTHLEVFRKAKKLEAAGKKIIHMEVGEPDYPPPAVIGDALAESIWRTSYSYPRRTICRFCSDNLVVTSRAGITCD